MYNGFLIQFRLSIRDAVFNWKNTQSNNHLFQRLEPKHQEFLGQISLAKLVI